MNKHRRIAVITGSRAEFGLLAPVLRALRQRPRLETRLIVTGMHLPAKFGRTIEDIRRGGWPIDAVVKMQTGRDAAAGEPQAFARGVAGIARALEHFDSEIVLVLGDRIEALAGACAAVLGRRVLTHIHGGDRAAGDVDDVLRNAITRLAHVHLVASREAAERLRRMGEPPGRIHLVGAPGLDDIRLFKAAQRKGRRASRRRLAELLGPLAGRKYAVVVQHPCGRPPRLELAAMRNIVAAVEKCGLSGVTLYPNSDPGHESIIRVLGGLRKNPHWRVFKSLPRDDYLLLLAHAAVQVGNSSSGIIESAGIGVNAVNIGPRQQGRLRCGPSVIDGGESAAAIARGIRRALVRPRPRAGRSVYGDGRAGRRIARVLECLIIAPALLKKALTC